jgi:hypothetical protein
VRKAAARPCTMQRFVQLAGVATLALVLVAATLAAIDSRGLQTDVLVEQQAMFQQLPEFQIGGTMQTGAPAPQGIPLSFQLPVPLPAPSPPAPTVITVGPRPKKAPVCKRCERQMRKIKVSSAGGACADSAGLGFLSQRARGGPACEWRVQRLVAGGTHQIHPAATSTCYLGSRLVC